MTRATKTGLQILLNALVACLFLIGAAAHAQECVDVVHAPTGQVMFEDLWPATGDHDYNDALISYSYDFTLQDGAVTSIRATFNALAAGAVLENGASLHIPGLLASQVASITDYYSDGSSATGTTAYQPQDPSSSDLVTNIYSCIRQDAFGGASGFINTDPSLPITPGRAVSIVITLNSPLAGFDTGAAPFDIFIMRCDDFSYQIHLPQFDGTATGGTQAYFGHGDDGSTPERHYVTSAGLPWALAVPDAVAWPQETQHIDDVYNDITAFATTGGTAHQDWYQTNIATSIAFTQGDGTPAPTPIAVSSTPPVTNLCAPEQAYCDPSLCNPDAFDANGFGAISGAVSDGSAENPYLICSKAQLENIHANLDANSGYAGKTFCITNDIDLGGGDWAPIGANTAIGNFEGTLDGNNKTLSNLTVNHTGTPSGLFSGIETATLKDLTLTNVNISGGYYTGGLVGLVASGGTITNVSVSGSISGTARVGGVVGYVNASLNTNTNISGISSSGTVTATSSPVGGAIGGSSPGATALTITDSSSSATVTGGAGAYGGEGTGGFMGYADSGTVLQSCFATGAVSGVDGVGGFVGMMDGSPLEVWAYDSYASGAVTGTGDGTGGFVGFTNYGDQTRCYATGNVIGYVDVGGFGGVLGGQTSWNGFITGETYTIASVSTGSVQGVTHVGGFAGQSIHQISNSASYGPVTTLTDPTSGLYGDGAGGFIGWACVDDRTSTPFGFLAYNYTASSLNSGGPGGTTNAGGFAGLLDHPSYGSAGLATIESQSAAYQNFWDTTTSGQASDLFATGFPTAQMQDPASYTAWPTATENDWDLTIPAGYYPYANWAAAVPAIQVQ